MGSTFTATSTIDLFANPSHTVAISYTIVTGPFEPHFRFGFNGGDLPHDGDPIDAIEDFAFANGEGLYFVTVFAGNAVDYSASTAPVFIDLLQSTQHGGFAEGDRFFSTMTGIDDSSFDDVIRGDDLFPDRDDVGITATFNNPGNNIFNGGGGNDLLEGRGGADTLNGQSGFDLASYESSSAAVTVRLAGVNGDTQTALASGGDAAGDRLSSIEGLVGSVLSDHLTGNSLDNLLAGGLGSDTLNGMDGTDTADYSRDHFFDLGDTPTRVEVHLGLGSASGTADEFLRQRDGTLPRVSTDTLISIENVIGTAGSDVIVGNELDNRLEGREGNNVLDGGLGNDVLVGGRDLDTADYTSHDAVPFTLGEQYDIAVSSAAPAASRCRNSPRSFRGRSRSSKPTITGNELANTLDGRGGSDIIDGGLGNDIIIGNTGIDTASFVSHDGLAVEGGRDVISLGNGTADGSYSRFQALGPIRQLVETDVLRSIENVTGSNRDEAINGNDGANVLNGRDGNDIIDGGLGNDTIIGDTGNNTASWLSHDAVAVPPGGEQVTISLGLGALDGSYVRTALVSGQQQPVETDVLRGIQNVTGSSHFKIINGNESANVLDGRGGGGIIDGGLGNDTIIGSNSSFDRVSYVSHDGLPLLPGEINLLQLGLGGADGSYTRFEIINGVLQPAETDILRGIENVTGSSHSEIIIGNEQENTLSGRDGDDTLAGRGSNDTIFGGPGNDTYDFTGGGLGTDTFFDESGTGDRVIINSFNDILFNFPVDGVPTGRDGDDLVVVLTTGTFRIVGHFDGHQIETIVARDTGQSMVLATGLTGGNAPGIIAGGNGGQTLDGRGGDDFLVAGNGPDRLIGGDGNDRLIGGHGPDTFVFGPRFGHDVVVDYSAADHIEFDGGLFQGFEQVMAASQQVGADTVITFDAGNSITLLGVPLSSLHASHFDFF
jgi:Ca2+-binding RTX toxin-like protein